MTHDNRGGRYDGKHIPGIALIVVGVLFLIGGGGLFGWLGKLLWAGVLGVLAYLSYQEGQRTGKNLYRLIAIPLAALALVSLFPGATGGALFLAAMGLAFAFVWRRDRSRWWAIIPAGALGTLALIPMLGPAQAHIGSVVFFLGLGATFFALTRLRDHAQPWAVYPAIALAVLALLSISGGASWLVPLFLVAIGLVLLYRTGALGDVERALRGGLGRTSRSDSGTENPTAATGSGAAHENLGGQPPVGQGEVSNPGESLARLGEDSSGRESIPGRDGEG
jgi:hypothetical protein